MRRLRYLAVVGPLLVTESLRAEEPAPSVKETSLIAGFGADGGPSMKGVGFSLLGTHRLHWAEVGVEGRAIGPLPLSLSAGGVAGLHFGNQFSVRLLGAGGVRYYDGVGKGILSDDPGISGATPYVGARAMVGWSFQRRSDRKHGGYLGLMGTRDYDLARETRSVTYTEHGWLFGTSWEVTETHTIGQSSFGVFLVGAVDFDLTEY